MNTYEMLTIIIAGTGLVVNLLGLIIALVVAILNAKK